MWPLLLLSLSWMLLEIVTVLRRIPDLAHPPEGTTTGITFLHFQGDSFCILRLILSMKKILVILSVEHYCKDPYGKVL